MQPKTPLFTSDSQHPPRFRHAVYLGGYVGFENKHSPGRPVEATAQEKIHELLKTDRKSYLNEISEGYNKQKYHKIT